MSGKVYFVSTPIGNLDDLTLRALETLRRVDLIAAEDTRRTRQLLAHFDLHTPLESFHAFNEHEKADALLDRIEAGLNVAAVSDAGTPSIADPGFFLLRGAVRRGMTPVVIPGVSALTFAATASALPVDTFSFLAFPPVKPGRRRKFFETIRNSERTCFFFESVHKMPRLLDEIAEIIGAEADVAIIREATKLHEEVIRGKAGELAKTYAGHAWKGEFVIGVHSGRAKSGPSEDADE